MIVCIVRLRAGALPARGESLVEIRLSEQFEWEKAYERSLGASLML
jgi:hypothetical protein